MNAQLQELACLYVLDQLEARDRAAFETELLKNRELAAYVQQLEGTLAGRVRALPQFEPGADLLNRIEQTLDRSAEGRPLKQSQTVRPISWFPLLRWGLAAVIAVSLATLAVQSLRRPAAPLVVFVQLDANRSTATEVALPKSTRDADARFIQLASLAESYWQKPDRLPIKLAGSAGGSRGYALFDPSSREGFIGVEQLPSLSENKRYHLWIVNSATGLLSDAGILPVTANGAGLYSFSLPDIKSKPDEPLGFFVTVENAGATSAPAEPRGEIVLGKGVRL